jgi:hypothetical protein
MLVTRKSMVSGVVRTIDLPITEEQVNNYSNGMLLQDAFPNLSKSDREFYKSGITDEEWQSIFGNPEDEEE